MKRHFTKLIAIGAMAAGMAFAQAPARPAAGRAQAVQARIQQRLMKVLALTDAQKAQAKTIRQATREQVQSMAPQLKQQRQALNAAVQAGDTTKIQQLSLEVGNLQGHVLAVRSAGKAQFFALLTPEQKTKAAEFRQKVKQVLGGNKG